MTTPIHASAAGNSDVRSYLINVAETLQHAVIPALEGNALTRANECVTILARLAARATAPNTEPQSRLDDLLANGLTLDSPDAADLDGDVLDAEEREASTVLQAIIDKPATGQRSFDSDRLEGYLRTQAIGSPDLVVSDAVPLAGGRSKQTVRVTQQNCSTLPPQFILRQDWVNSVTGTSIAHEYGILHLARDAGIRVPEPLLLETSDEPLGAPFLLVGCIEGSLVGDLFEPPRSEHLALQFAEQLGRLHAMGDSPFAGLPGIVEKAYSQRQLQAELAGFEQIILQLGRPNATVNVALSWLQAHIAQIEGPRVLVHGDLGFHNFLVENDTLTALLDWELAHFGNPAEDLGYVKNWVERMIGWERFMDAYHAAGGPLLATQVIDFYVVWGKIRLYTLLLRARAAIVTGSVHDCEVTLCAVHFLPMLLHLLSATMRTLSKKH